MHREQGPLSSNNRRLICSKSPSRFVWPIVVLGFLALLPSLVQGQNVGYVVNTTDGTVTIFGTVPGSSRQPNRLEYSDRLRLQATNGRGCPYKCGLRRLFFSSKPTGYALCDLADNSLWAIDLTNLGLGQPLVPQNINVGNPLQLSLPTGMVINSVTCTGMDDFADNCYHDIAFIVNSQSNTVSMMDTATNGFLRPLLSLPRVPLSHSPLRIYSVGTSW